VSTASIFILISFSLGVLVGSVITYAIMGKYFADALEGVAQASKEVSHELSAAKETAVKTSQKSFVLVIIAIGALALVIAISYFVAKSGYRPGSQVQDNIGENLENLDNTKALKGLTEGMKRAN